MNDAPTPAPRRAAPPTEHPKSISLRVLEIGGSKDPPLRPSDPAFANVEADLQVANVEADLQVRLKVVLHTELHDARRTGLRRDAAECPRVEIRQRIATVEMIRQVE